MALKKRRDTHLSFIPLFGFPSDKGCLTRKRRKSKPKYMNERMLRARVYDPFFVINKKKHKRNMYVGLLRRSCNQLFLFGVNFFLFSGWLGRSLLCAFVTEAKTDTEREREREREKESVGNRESAPARN
jgi:hypothetical protein